MSFVEKAGFKVPYSVHRPLGHGQGMRLGLKRNLAGRVCSYWGAVLAEDIEEGLGLLRG